MLLKQLVDTESRRSDDELLMIVQPVAAALKIHFETKVVNCFR